MIFHLIKWEAVMIISLQNKCRTVDPDRQNLGRSGKLSFFVIFKFWQNCASLRQVPYLILKTGFLVVPIQDLYGNLHKVAVVIRFIVTFIVYTC